MADLLVVTGPPGAGKSTVADLVVAAFDDVALVPGDVFFSFRRRGAIAPWLPQAHARNAVSLRAAALAAATFAAAGTTVVYDGVVGPWFLALFAEAAGRAGPSAATGLHYAVLLPSLDTCRRRVAGRTGHGFTDDDATVRMHAEFAAADVDPRHLLADPPDAPPRAPADVARRVLERYASGDLRYRPAA